MGNFDQFADTYQRVHSNDVRETGENSEYFAQYKARYIARRMGGQFSGRILDYGCGVGMLSKLMKQTFPQATVDGYDASNMSIGKVDSGIRAQGTFTSDSSHLARHYDLVVVTNVIHHLRPDQRQEVIAILLPKAEATGYVLRSGLEVSRRDYIVFFARLLAWFRQLEPYLSWCPAGAQYALVARRAGDV